MEMHDGYVTGLAPVYRSDARLLVLGSMPGRVSLEAGAYYAHPRNAFWPLLYGFYGLRAEASYDARLRFAVEHGIALWDSAKSCRRPGSLDAAMRDIVGNDFGALFAACPRLRAVACNGARAYALFCKSPFAGLLPALRLPSTSPAHAAMGFEGKAQAWARAFSIAKEE